MRATKPIVAIAAACLFMGLTACSSNSDTAATTTVTQTVTVTAATPAPTSSYTPPPPVLTDEQRQEIVDYYLSEERQAPLEEALHDLGTQWRDLMLSGQLPMETRAWSKLMPAPRNGYGSLVSETRDENDRLTRPFLQVNVKFTDGVVDTSEPPVGLTIIMPDGTMLDLNGRTPLADIRDADGSGIPVPGSPVAFSWSERIPGEGEPDSYYGFYVTSADQGAQMPEDNQPLDRNQRLKIGAHDITISSVDDIVTADAWFLHDLATVAQSVHTE